MGKQHTAIIHLGSNIGDRKANLDQAIQHISRFAGQCIATSKHYETEAWGETAQDDFINQAIMIHTEIAPKELLATLLNIEEKMGRVRVKKWGPRSIDIDLIFYDDLVIEEKGLQIPHPRLHLRNFVLIPLLDIAANFEHPIFKKSIEELYIDCRDESEVVLLD